LSSSGWEAGGGIFFGGIIVFKEVFCKTRRCIMDITRIIDKIDSFSQGSYVLEKNSAQENHERKQTVEHEPGVAEIFDAVEKLNQSTEGMNEKVHFSYHEKTNRVIMRIIDSETNEVIREVPAKDAIKLLEHIQEYLGMFVDESR